MALADKKFDCTVVNEKQSSLHGFQFLTRCWRKWQKAGLCAFVMVARELRGDRLSLLKSFRFYFSLFSSDVYRQLIMSNVVTYGNLIWQVGSIKGAERMFIRVLSIKGVYAQQRYIPSRILRIPDFLAYQNEET